MKYNIKINQKALSYLAPELDIIDGAIIGYIRDFIKSDNIETYTQQNPFFKYEKMKAVDKSLMYYWISNTHLLKEMPLLHISCASAIKKRMNKIQKHGFIVRAVFNRYKSTVYVAKKTYLLDFGSKIGNKCSNCRNYCEDCIYFDKGDENP